MSDPVPSVSVPVSTHGLDAETVRRRQAADGPNALPGQGRHGWWGTIREVISEPMFILLAVAGGVYLAMGEPADAALLLGFVGVVMGITIVQERRSERALSALRNLTSPRALVVRGGQQLRIAAGELVVGDLIVLAEGDRVPADALLRSGRGLALDESLLTGESVAVRKRSSATATLADEPGGPDLPTVFSGSLVTAGQGQAEVIAIGAQTALGRIGTSLSHVITERTRLQRETGRLVRILAIFGLSLCTVMVVVYALTRGGDLASWKQGLLAGIALAMAVLPEEFPVILTVFLALGAWRIAQHRVLTRRLPAIETIGAITVLCTDKTGTLTRNEMVVAEVVPVGQAEAAAVIDTAILASRSQPFDPMERALVAAGAHLPSERHAGWVMEREYPLSAGLFAVTQVWQPGGGAVRLVAVKGAPEAIADLCRLTPDVRADLLRRVGVLADAGLRVLGVAQGTVPAGGLPADPTGFALTWSGLIGLADPLRENVPGAVAECRTAGIRVVMITGDYPATARSIARQAGIAEDPEIITGPELTAMAEPELAQRIRTVQVFARVAPAQKLRLVEALKGAGEVVAMTGDGVNDAPALKAAHIGIAMGGRGTDVAREAAALVLLDDDFASIVAAVRMGRRIYANIRKAVGFTCAVHVPIAGLSLLPVFIPGWPLLLLPVHIVFLEMVINPACALVFEAEAADPEGMRQPPRSPSEPLFAWAGLAVSLGQGALALVACVLVFVLARAELGDDVARALTFSTLVISCLAIIISSRSWSRSVFTVLRTPNPAQWWVIAGTLGFLALVLAIPAASRMFHFAPPPLLALAASLVAGVLPIAWFEVVKYRRRQRARRGG